MLRFENVLLGTLQVNEDGFVYDVEIRRGNALAVFVVENESSYSLWSFFADEVHLKNIVKSGFNPFTNVTSFRLNMAYKECMTMIKHLPKLCEVTCYYSA